METDKQTERESRPRQTQTERADGDRESRQTDKQRQRADTEGRHRGQTQRAETEGRDRGQRQRAETETDRDRELRDKDKLRRAYKVGFEENVTATDVPRL